jgi:hypothetical protein
MSITEYEQKCNIYMNFSVDEDGIWGLPEGSRSQHYLNNSKVNQYKQFLVNAIEYYNGLIKFDMDASKKRDKFKKYLKRLETAIKKMI